MLHLKRHTLRSWPILAITLMTAFIVYGVTLISRSGQLQVKITQEVTLLDELSRLTGTLHQLGLTHRMDVGTRQFQWPVELERAHSTIDGLQERFLTSPGMAELPDALEHLLHQADSLHSQAMAANGSWSDQRPNEVVFQFMMQRAQQAVDRTTRQVHEQGLGALTRTLSARWDEAQLLLLIACLVAAVLAWLVGVRNKLLMQAHLRSEQLDVARQNLERVNRDLRETMLSKEEKEVMLKEIHHRVKNNLQIVKSLIRFQMEQVKDPTTIELFNECVNRVSAMALVHEQTYLSKDLANIDVNAYLSHLTRDLCYAYSIDIELQLDIRIEVPTLSVDTLIPLGLVINEIISNSLKYAFKGRKKGTILVHLSGNQEHGLHLRIGDDGVGLPDRTKWDRPETLGMDLIHTLAGQLDTRVELVAGPGTVYELVSLQEERRKRA
jgi:two-component sensor histidine kinase